MRNNMKKGEGGLTGRSGKSTFRHAQMYDHMTGIENHLFYGTLFGMNASGFKDAEPMIPKGMNRLCILLLSVFINQGGYKRWHFKSWAF